MLFPTEGDLASPARAAALRPRRKWTTGSGSGPALFRSTAHEVIFVFQATVATASSTFLTGASAIVTASIGGDLATTPSEISWIAVSTSLTAGAFQLGLGRLADLLGRRRMFIAGTGSFAAFALTTGFARNPLWMDLLCGMLGISSAMMLPPAIGILGAAYDRPSRRKNLVFSAFSSGNPLGFAIGSLLGGTASQLFNWRASYFLIAIIWGTLTIVAFWAVPNVEAVQHNGEPSPSSSSPRPLPPQPAGPDGGGSPWAWAMAGGSPRVIAVLAVGLVLLAFFCYWGTIWPHPLMPPKIWKDPDFTLLIVSLVLGNMAFYSSSFWLPYFLQLVQKREPLDVAVHLLPQPIAGLLWNVVMGLILHHVKNTLLHGIGAVAYPAFIFPALVINVIGADFQFNVVNMDVMQSLPSHQQALAGGIFNTMIRLWSAVALGISTVVFNSVGHSEEGVRDPMLSYTQAFLVSVAFAVAGIPFVPFIRVSTQGNDKAEDEDGTASDGPPAPDVGVSQAAAGGEVTSSTK
ncbi:hypothetical protein MAPG_11292 [Magnaporthiopsis poae ATCC 64411]|uniref:Major facilitator superfamily (MFS) profile domain-containing protein n=1 Tax=Magnaporthiopsis poae (strain ATCC 64411 / 73-15) TaxID=644358 RepID=A0A0C4EEW0_MAGP6|nr:hypothetical protein MAPG_11292 [Magnaporthiopsis poae ATCC 64411]